MGIPQKVVKKLRGKPGTSVTIWIRREGEEELLVSGSTENIRLKSVRSEMLDEDWIYQDKPVQAQASGRRSGSLSFPF